MRFACEQDLPGFEPGVDVEVLAKSDRFLTGIARQLGILPLNDFYSSFPAGEIDDAGEYGDADQEDWRVWSEPEEGLATVTPIVRYLEELPEDPGITPAVLANLKSLEQALLWLKEHHVRWTLEVY